MRILHCVEYYAPSRGGAQEVVRRVSEELARHGHDVTVATTHDPGRPPGRINGVDVVGFDLHGNSVRGIRGESWRYQKFLVEGAWDVVMTYAAQQWTTDLCLDVLDEMPSARVCAPCGYSALGDPAYAPYFARLPEALAKFDATIYHSETYQDIEFGRRHGHVRCFVVPNGAALSEFGPSCRETADRFRREHRLSGRVVLTVGSHTGVKGHRQAMAAFAMAVTGPADLVVAGNGEAASGCLTSCTRWAGRLNRLLASRRKRISVLDLPRDELVAAYAAADLFLLLSLIECSPIVLFEAGASGTPFLSADVGNAREIAAWTGGGEVLPPGPMIRGRARAAPLLYASRRLGTLLADEERLVEMGTAARSAWEDRFTWEAIALRYLDVYRTAIEVRQHR